MASVTIEYKSAFGEVLKKEEIRTSGDSTYVFDDISNHVHRDGEFYNVPIGTKEIVMSIPCDM
jgi:hypothetical protein